MAVIYIYADETGNLDYDVIDGSGASPYFGFGTVSYIGDHGNALWGGLALRAAAEGRLSSSERTFASGFHAVDDSARTRHEVYAEIARQEPRFDATLLYKPNANRDVRERGEMYLYQLAWYLHLKFVVKEVAKPGDHVIVVVATLGTSRRRNEARAAIRDVCEQVRVDFTLCVWDAATSWGLQVVDYALWATQRRETRGKGSWWGDYVRPITHSVFFPWNCARERLDWSRT